MLRSKTGNRNERVNKANKDGYKTVKTPSLLPRKFTKANMHEIFSELISENSLSEQIEVDVPEDEPESESTFLVNSTSTNSINPGDNFKLITSAGKIKSTSNKKQKYFSNEITMNGKAYREFSQHATCCITKSSKSSL